jgi:hypothetical protein
MFFTFESAFAPYVGFGVLMTSNLGTNALYLRFATATSLMKDAKVRLKMKWYPPIFVRGKSVGINLELNCFSLNSYPQAAILVVTDGRTGKTPQKPQRKLCKILFAV